MRGKRERKETETGSIFGGVLTGTAFAFGLCFFLLLVCAVLLETGVVGEDTTGKLVIFSCAVGTLAGGRVAVGKSGANPWVGGGLTGLSFCLLLLLVSFITEGTPALPGSGLWILLGAMAGGGISVILGGGGKKKKKHKQRS